MITKQSLPQHADQLEMRLKFDNGDLDALRTVMRKFGFKDEQAALRFALVVLLKTDSEGVYVTRGTERVFVSPSDDIIDLGKKMSQSA